jgi:hypothetical protein
MALNLEFEENEKVKRTSKRGERGRKKEKGNLSEEDIQFQHLSIVRGQLICV